jgi:UDP-2-acetamido-3-amino-2,3-dideoxy-glucuronate N-acetyltransferase
MADAQLTSLSDVRQVRLQTVAEEGALLAIAQCQTHVPFTIRRAFMVVAMQDNVCRGRHAHRAQHQFLVCASGEIDVILDDATARSTHNLASPDIGLYMPPGIWSEYKFRRKGSILLAFCDTSYDEADYIRDHARFIRFKREQADMRCHANHKM